MIHGWDKDTGNFLAEAGQRVGLTVLGEGEEDEMRRRSKHRLMLIVRDPLTKIIVQLFHFFCIFLSCIVERF